MADQKNYKEAIDTWEKIATAWDDGIGAHGNKYWVRLQRPCLERLIDVKPGCRALDLATGNGIVARWLAGQGAEVTAADGAQNMVQVAIERTAQDQHAHRISFRKLDVTDTADFAALLESTPLAKDGFDVVTVNMALMDISDIEPLANFLPKLLKKDGVFVAQLLHPVFVTSTVKRIIEISDEHKDGVPCVTRGKLIREYMSVAPWKGIAVRDQSALQWYFHRSMHELFGTFFKCGLVMDRMEELAFDDDAATPERLEAQSNFTQFPMILAFRMRKLA